MSDELIRSLRTKLDEAERENARLREDVGRWNRLAQRNFDEMARKDAALQNLLGVYDTPVSRRRYPQDDFIKEAIQSARAALTEPAGERDAGPAAGELIDVIKFYADEANWKGPEQVNEHELFDTAMGADLGAKARAALKTLATPAQPVTGAAEMVMVPRELIDAAREVLERRSATFKGEKWPTSRRSR